MSNTVWLDYEVIPKPTPTFMYTEVDLLALSVAKKRLHQENIPVYYEITDHDFVEHVTPDDVANANVIRDYYSKKLMLLALKEVMFTSFRQDLAKFINTDGKRFDKTMVPLVYKLPYFYEYDLQIKGIFDTKIDKIIDKDEFYFIGKTIKTRRSRQKLNEYWFRDSDHNIVSVAIEQNNPLLNFWDTLVNFGKPLKLTGTKVKRFIDGEVYLELRNFKPA